MVAARGASPAPTISNRASGWPRKLRPRYDLRMLRHFLLLFALAAQAQLIPTGQPIPRTAKIPVVFLNGYQFSCQTPATFAGTFGTADQVLQRSGYASVYFDNCVLANRPSIEELGDRFGQFLRDLRYDDGQPVPAVHVVAHSMGGLIVRSYLAGKGTAPGVFSPPAETRIQRAVFLSTPHFGTAAAIFGSDRQALQLAAGNRFFFDLATWNQGSDDLRGVDALSLIGDAGTGQVVAAKFDDGAVSLTSGSIGFVAANRTRILPYCHITGAVVSIFGICPSGTLGIANVTGDTHLSGRAIISFLEGNQDWQSVGQAPQQNSFLSTNGGIVVARTNDSALTAIESASVAPPVGAAQALSVAQQAIAYRELVTAGQSRITIRSGGSDRTKDLVLPAGVTTVVNFTDVPTMLPAASRVSPLALAPGMFVAIYGSNLAARTEVATALPFPTKLADTEVLINNSAIPLYFVSAGQINAVLPEGLTGRIRLVIRRTGVADIIFYALIEPAVPAIFTADASGGGLASALNAVTGQVVTTQNSLAANDYVALYLTGLGNTQRRDGLDWAVDQPTVTVGGKPCVVGYAGRAPGYAGLDQINCQLAADVATDSQARVSVTSRGRTSNLVTLPIR